jgi:hypothetical protein
MPSLAANCAFDRKEAVHTFLSWGVCSRLFLTVLGRGKGKKGKDREKGAEGEKDLQS